MGLAERHLMYQELETRRGRPLLVYVTSNRLNAGGAIASDSVPEVLQQLQLLPHDTKEIDFLIVSDGGDPTVAWRIVSLIRERVQRLTVLVPQAAYSAATLVVLGADEVVMHPNGNLGPTDPQIRTQRRGQNGGTDAVAFGSEDLMAYLRFAKDQVGLSTEQMLAVYSKFCDEVGAVALGVSARSALLSVSLGEKLLRLHMKDTGKAKSIAEKLTKDYFHHGYPVNRSEAKEIGLNVAKPDSILEDMIWRIWADIAEELELRHPHNAVTVLKNDPACAPLFAPLAQIALPANLPPQIAQQAYQQILANIQVQQVPPASYQTIHALVESSRYASRFLTVGQIFGVRQADQQIRISNVIERQQWETIQLAAATKRSAGADVARRKAKTPTPGSRIAKTRSKKPLK